MLIYPAIDIIGGRAVRLFQGDYNKKQVFGEDPFAFAAAFEEQGAAHLHLVDLDGAKAGAPCNFALVERICKHTGLFVELGGGIRSAETVERCFAAGVSRVILGTAALKDPDFTRRMAARHAGKIAVGVDARDGKVAVDGWLQTSQQDSLAFCREMAAIGVRHVIYTDIARDGAEKGANLTVYEKLAALEGLMVTASGGVSTLEDVAALRDMGLHAAILGKALYTGAVNLAAAIALARRPPAAAREGGRA